MFTKAPRTESPWGFFCPQFLGFGKILKQKGRNDIAAINLFCYNTPEVMFRE